MLEHIPHSDIPQLTTQETARLRNDYPCIEHLEAGNVSAWLVERQDQLLIRAKDERTGMNLAKLITLAGGAVGAVCYATSPLALIGALVAGTGYIWSVAQDMNDSHQFAPIPFVRGNIIDFLQAMGDADSREEWFANRNELVDLMFHLDPFERYEFGMLKGHTHVLADYLANVASGKKFYAYRWLLDWYINLKGDFPSQEQLTQHLSKVSSDPRVNYQQVGAIASHLSAASAFGAAQAAGTKQLNPTSESAVNGTPLSKWLAEAPANTVQGTTPEVTIEASVAPVTSAETVFHADPLINELVKATLKSLASRDRTGKTTDTVEFVNAVDGYKFWRLVFRKLPQTSADALLKSSQNLYSDLGMVLPNLAKAPLIAQIKGGKFAVDAAKPMDDWRTAYFRDYIVPENWSFESPVRLPVGVDLDGTLIDINLSNHNLGRLLVGGSPGGGKSNFGVAALCAIACQYSPSSVKLLLSDVQQVELNPFKKLPHLYAPVASTPEETIDILKLAESEMDARQALFAAAGVNNIDGYNATVAPQERLPRVVVLIEEMADIVASSCGDEFNELQNRFLRLGRKWGFYWIGSTQTPRREVIPPEIRALYAAFLAFMCTRPSESKILLGEQDESACQLLGYGDGIFMSNLGSDRVQTLMVESQEVKAICDRVIATYGSYQPRKPRVVEQNNLDTVRERLEDALNLPFDGEEVSDRPADQPTSRPTNPITPPKKQNLSNSLHRPTDQPTDQEDDWDKFGRIKRGRMAKPPVSKTKLIQELFNITYDSGNGFDRYERQYYEIIEQFDRDWIIELLQDKVPERLIVEIVWSRKKLNADYDRYLTKVTQIKEEIEQ